MQGIDVLVRHDLRRDGLKAGQVREFEVEVQEAANKLGVFVLEQTTEDRLQGASVTFLLEGNASTLHQLAKRNYLGLSLS